MTDWQAVDQIAVREARRALLQRWPDLVSSTFSYGAVDLDTRHLVVWILLTGPADRRPEWFFPSEDEDVDDELGFGLLGSIYPMLDLVRATYAEHDWPDAADIRVGFDSAARVGEAGWTYFR